MSLDEKDLLQKLIRIPSVNPDLDRGTHTGGGEAALADFLQNFFQNYQWPWLRQTVHPGRDNLIAVVHGTSPQADSEVILWEAHQDTVGVEGMRIDPFAAHDKEGRIWGRGACDVKGGMAAMLTALTRIQQQPTRHAPTIVLALCVNEECGFTGAQALSRIWLPSTSDTGVGEISGPLSLAELRQLRPRQAIVAEPTMLNVVVAHKGVLRWRCCVRGRAAHSSRPDQGVNAIYTMAEVVRMIQRFQHEVLSLRAAHSLCGGPSVCVSTIRGGTGVNTVPDEVVIDIDRRIAPGEQPDEVCQELKDWVAAHTQCGEATIEHELPWLESPGLDDRINRVWGEQVAGVVRSVGAECELLGVPYGTDAPSFAACEIPTVVFGPGLIEQAHTDDEWLDVDQLSRAVDILCRLACDHSH